MNGKLVIIHLINPNDYLIRMSGQVKGTNDSN